MPSFRPSTPADIHALYAVWRSAVEATHDFLSAADLDFYADLVRNSFLPQGGFTVAVADGALVAFIKMEGDLIDALFVAPSHHNRGIGRALVERAAEGRRVLLVDVNEQNQGACAFYRRLGFRRIGRSELDPGGRPYPLLHLRRDA